MTDSARSVAGPPRRRSGSAAGLLGPTAILTAPVALPQPVESDIADQPQPAFFSADAPTSDDRPGDPGLSGSDELTYGASPSPNDAAPPAAVGAATASTPLAKMTIRVRPESRARLRAVYYNTQAIEHDKSIESLIESLIVVECQRREQLYNGGQRFAGGNSPSVPGPKPRL